MIGVIMNFLFRVSIRHSTMPLTDVLREALLERLDPRQNLGFKLAVFDLRNNGFVLLAPYAAVFGEDLADILHHGFALSMEYGAEPLLEIKLDAGVDVACPLLRGSHRLQLLGLAAQLLSRAMLGVPGLLLLAHRQPPVIVVRRLALGFSRLQRALLGFLHLAFVFSGDLADLFVRVHLRIPSAPPRAVDVLHCPAS
jgi:hypothetical protein